MNFDDDRGFVKSNGITRRALLRRGLWGTVGLAGAAVLTPLSAALQGPTLAHAAAQPRSGGTLTMWTQGDPPNFDLHQNSIFLVNWAMAPCYNQSVQFEPQNPSQVAPDLATRWEMAADGKSYRFFLHQGVRFHDGRPADQRRRQSHPRLGASTAARRREPTCRGLCCGRRNSNPA